MDDASPKDIDPSTVVGRRVRHSHVRDGEGKVRILLPAFRESRPGGTSVDMLWCTEPEPKKYLKLEHLKAASVVCAEEKFSAVGLAVFKTQTILKLVKGFYRALATPTPSNARHGELMPEEFLSQLQIAEDDPNAKDIKRANSVKADILAKALSDFHADHGDYFRFALDEKNEDPDPTKPIEA